MHVYKHLTLKNGVLLAGEAGVSSSESTSPRRGMAHVLSAGAEPTYRKTGGKGVSPNPGGGGGGDGGGGRLRVNSGWPRS